MRWDDLQLLKFLDDRETQGALTYQSAYELLRLAAQEKGHHVVWGTDDVAFAKELLLANEAGYLEWTDQSFRNIAPTNPLQNANIWLQEIRELRLTLEGRDRARGRLIVQPLPDPDEDDDRLITGRTLEEIARAIGDTYTATQLPRYLRDSGVPAEFVVDEVTEDRWTYVFDLFERLLDGGSAARRVLRTFLGGWLEGRYHEPPTTEQRKRFVALLARQGWRVADGRLVIGEQTHDSVPPATLLGRDARIATLHPEIKQVIEPYLEGDLLHVAVFEAFKAINNRVKVLAELDLDGSALMGQAFADADPVLALADLATETGRNVQAGYRLLFTGAVRGIRNPNAHEKFQILNDDEALELLGFASLLMRRLDLATIPES